VIGGDPDMRSTLFDHPENRTENTAHCTDLAPVDIANGWKREEVAE
jgi:hypothetical protein